LEELEGFGVDRRFRRREQRLQHHLRRGRAAAAARRAVRVKGVEFGDDGREIRGRDPRLAAPSLPAAFAALEDGMLVDDGKIEGEIFRVTVEELDDVVAVRAERQLQRPLPVVGQEYDGKGLVIGKIDAGSDGGEAVGRPAARTVHQGSDDGDVDAAARMRPKFDFDRIRRVRNTAAGRRRRYVSG